MDEIQVLTQRVGDLGRAVDFWNVVMLWGLALAAVAAIIIGISTRLIVLRAGQQAESQGLLSVAKDRKAQASLALAEQHAAEANTKAEGFRLEIARSNEASARAQAQVAGATAEAAKANLELAKLKTPRTLSRDQQLRIANKLLPYSGQQFAPFVFADAESRALIELIANALISSGWVLAEPKSDLRIGKAGVTSQSGLLIQFSPSRSRDIGLIAGKLAEALNAEGVEAIATPNPSELEATPSVINLIVGSKPMR